MIYLYAITGPLNAPPDGAGLEGAPLEALTVGGLTAVYSSHAHLDQRADPDSCWAHEHAVETVMASQAVLPARFGTTFEGVDELRAAVTGNAEALMGRLTELEGCVELAVRIGHLMPEEHPPETGRDYLRAKLSDQRRREALAEGTLACLRELAVSWKLATQTIHSDKVSISYLVRATEVERFVRAVERLARRWPEFALSATGPWAPYSFASIPLQVPEPGQRSSGASRAGASVGAA